MPPPSPLAVATSVLNRLVKEESSYHKELEQQNARLAKLESEEGDENKDFTLKQQKQAIEETKAIFPSLRTRIGEAIGKLESQLEVEQEKGSDGNAEEITKAKEAAAKAKASYTETS